MRGPSLVFVVLLAACGGSVRNPNAGGDNDARSDDEPTDQLPGQQVTAMIADGTRVADAARTIGLTAVTVTADEPTYTWSFGDGSSATGLSVTHTYASHGCYSVTLTVSAPRATSASTSVNVYAPADLDVDLGPLPAEHAIIPRRAPFPGFGELDVTGTIASPGWEAIEVVVLEGDTVVANYTDPLCSSGAETFAVSAGVPAALKSYDVVVRASVGSRHQVLAEVADVTGGDVLVIQGQSNAVASNYQGVTLESHPFVRTFGSASIDESASVAANDWVVANGNTSNAVGSIGQWGMKMARDLVELHQVPLAVFNGAHGGQPIGFFQRDDANHVNTTTNYGRLLRRLRAAAVDQHVRAVLYFQGESDGSNAAGHTTGLTALASDWRDDHPTIEHIYVTQVRPGCGAPSLELRDGQRLLGQTLQGGRAMSTSAMDAHDGCHYLYNGGYELLGEHYFRMLSRDLYAVGGTDIDAIDVEGATYLPASNTIRIQTRNDASALTLEPGMETNITVTGTTATVTGVTLENSTLVLQLSAGTGAPTSVRYNAHQGAGATLLNARGFGLLAFILPL